MARQVMGWLEEIQYDPFMYLHKSNDAALKYYAGQLVGTTAMDNVENLWELKEPERIIKKQNPDGSWTYRGNRPGDEYGENYELLETWRKLNSLVYKYGFNNKHNAIQKAAEYLFSCQTPEGDIRGILSNQYTPYYLGAFLATLIKAGYEDDKRISLAFHFLESMRQNDGGWIIPMAMYKTTEYYSLCQKEPIQPDRSLPFSHMATGMVIRAYAAHPVYCQLKIAKHTGKLLKNRLFKKDTFTSRQAIAYWFKFQYPFWWTSLLTVLDSLLKIGFDRDDTDVKKGLGWFISHQNPDGGWSSGYGRKKTSESDQWITLAVCRVLKGFFE